MMIGSDLAILMPEIILSVFAMGGLILGAYTGKDALAGAMTWATALRAPSSVSVGMTTSALARFITSGICLARIALNWSSLIVPRASTRSRCISAGAETTTTRST